MRRILVSKEHPISPDSRFFFQFQYSYEHIFVQQETLCAEPCCVRNCLSREREGLYNGNVQQNPSCAASCVTKDLHTSLSPVLAYDFLPRCKFGTLTSIPMYSSRLDAQNPVFEIVHEESVKVFSTHVVEGICAGRVTAQNI